MITNIGASPEFITPLSKYFSPLTTWLDFDALISGWTGLGRRGGYLGASLVHRLLLYSQIEHRVSSVQYTIVTINTVSINTLPIYHQYIANQSPINTLSKYHQSIHYQHTINKCIIKTSSINILSKHHQYIINTLSMHHQSTYHHPMPH